MINYDDDVYSSMTAVIGVVNVPLFGVYRNVSELIEGQDVRLVKLSVNAQASASELSGELKEFDIVIAGSSPIYNKDLFRRLPKLKAVVRWGVGYDNVILKDATEEGVIASRLPSYVLKDSVAELTIALILSSLRRIPQAFDYVKRGGWKNHDLDGLKSVIGLNLEDLVVGIIGLGNIGFRVLELLKPFKPKKIFVYDPYIPASQVRMAGAEPVSNLDELLINSDIITIHAPLTSETKHMINREKFAKMKRGVCLINTARGGIIDTNALIWALEQGIVGFAALDVFDPEPIPPDHPIFKFKNIVLTPHIGSGTMKSYAMMDEYSIAESLRILRGQKPLWILNPEVLKSPKLRTKIQ